MHFIDYFKKNWSILSGLALFVTGVLSTFLREPLEYGGSEDHTFQNLGKFIAAIVGGLVLVAVIIFKSREHTSRWWSAAAIMLILSIVSFFAYEGFRQKWTCDCYSKGENILIGSDLNYPELPYVIANRHDCSSLLKGNHCDATRVWTKSSIDNHRLVLAVLYTLNIPLFIVAMMAVVQALYCARRQK